MSTITTIAATDLITNSRTVINTNFSNLNTDKFESSNVDTDTTLAANSDTKVASQKAVKAYINAQGNNLAPTGAVMPFAGASAPTGWLMADGSAVSRATYATLFGVISTVYGAGNGSTTFNVPNYKGRVPVGFNASETEFDVLGETGGTKTHTLTIAEMPSHTHTTDAAKIGGGASGFGAGNSITSTAANGSTGGDGAHNNLPPYISQNYIIKT